MAAVTRFARGGTGPWNVLALLVALVAAVSAAVPLLTVFSIWDDEGYMLVSLAHYVDEGHLYTKTFGQYGPVYFYAQGLFFQLLGLPVTHDMGRLVTLVYWVMSSVLAGVFVFRMSRSSFLAYAAAVCVMMTLKILANEPGHPQQVVVVLFMAGACLATPRRSGRRQLQLFLLGCVGAALLFTKINLGTYYSVALGYALICLLPPGGLRVAGLAMTLLYAAVFPWVLTRPGLDQGFRDYMRLVIVTGTATFAFGAFTRPADPWPAPALLATGAGLLAASLAIVAGTLMQGMTLDALFWGLIVQPAHHAGDFWLPLYDSRINLEAACIVVLGLGVFRVVARRMSQSPWLMVPRFVVGIGSICFLALPRNADIQWVVPFLPLTLIPRPGVPGSDTDAATLFPRLFVTAMAATVFLGTYPVAGSQIGVAAVPMILWAFLCIADAIEDFTAASPRARFGGLPLDALAGGAILLVFGGIAVARAEPSRMPPATELRGSTWLHLPTRQAAQFASIAEAVRSNCDTLFSMPELGSLNLWSGVPTPNGWNESMWMTAFSPRRQADIMAIIQNDERACVVVNLDILRTIWGVREARLATWPLTNYIETGMPVAARYGDYEIHVHPRRISPWAGGPGPGQ